MSVVVCSDCPCVRMGLARVARVQIQIQIWAPDILPSWPHIH